MKTYTPGEIRDRCGPDAPTGPVGQAMAHYADNKEDAQAAFAIVSLWCDMPLAKLPGLTTRVRLGAYIGMRGLTPHQAALREYLYRWGCVLNYGPRVRTGREAPHKLGLDGVVDDFQ